MTIEQWVNLPQSEDHKRDGIESLEALGRRVKVLLEFENKTPGIAQYRLAPKTDNATYSTAEQARNESFTALQESGSVPIEDGKATVEVILPVSGGDSYEIEAMYEGATKKSDLIETRRRLYYVSVGAQGVTVPDVGPVEDAFYNESEKYFIDLLKVEKSGDIQVKDVLFKDKLDDWVYKYFESLTLGALQPLTFIVAWVKRLVQRDDAYFSEDLELTMPAVGEDDPADVKFTVENPTNWPLLRGVKPDDDVHATWLVGLSCGFEPEECDDLAIDLPDERIVRVEEDIEITIKAADMAPVRRNVARKGKLFVMGTMALARDLGGVAFKGSFGGGVVMPTIGRDGAYSTAAMQRALIHEIGHAIGLAANGPTKAYQPDKHAKFYVEKSHTGPHCEAPASGQSLTYEGEKKGWSGAAGCVMFGQNRVGDNESPSTFCDLCAEHVRKVDVGTAGFNS